MAVNVSDWPEQVGIEPDVSAMSTLIPEQPQAARFAELTNELLSVLSAAVNREDCPAVNILVHTSDE